MTLRRDASLIPGAGEGLFACSNISCNTVVCRYNGIKFSKVELMNMYISDPVDFINSIHPTSRDLDNETVIVGQDSIDIADCGVLVNDSTKLKSSKPKDIKKYLNLSQSKANVEITYRNGDIYYKSIRDIVAGEELYTHYGLGYWLLASGKTPLSIIEIYKQCGIIQK